MVRVAIVGATGGVGKEALRQALVASLTTKWLTSSWEGSSRIEDEGLVVVWGNDSSARYAFSELPIFVFIGILGGLGGAIFNGVNLWLNRCRRALYSSTDPDGGDFGLVGRVVQRLGPRRAKVLEAVMCALLTSHFF